MYENVYYVPAVTEDVVGASAYDDAWFGVGEFVYEVALCLVYAVGGVYVVSQNGIIAPTIRGARSSFFSKYSRL